MDRLLLRPEEAAKALSVGRSKLYELLASGRLCSVTIDGCRRIRVEDLEAFVVSLSAPADPPQAPSTVGGGSKPSDAIDLQADRPLLFPDTTTLRRRVRPVS